MLVIVRYFVSNFFLLLACCGVTLICASTLALDEERLWLPRSYQTLYLSLVDSALAAESLERCVDVLDGTIDLAQSTKDKPVFRIRCRQENGKTYSEMVDGISFKTLTTPQAEVEVLTADELELLKIEEARLREEERVAHLRRMWQECDHSIREKTRLMNNVKRLTEEMPEPQVKEDNQTIFTLDFDAEDISGEKLQYRVHCAIRDEQLVELSIGKRP